MTSGIGEKSGNMKTAWKSEKQTQEVILPPLSLSVPLLYTKAKKWGGNGVGVGIIPEESASVL